MVDDQSSRPTKEVLLPGPDKLAMPPQLDYESPLVSFFKQDSIAAFLLLIAAAAALVISNSQYAGWYESLLQSHLGIAFEQWQLDQSLHHWINDGLMCIFFFVVGLEIKREILVGELASVRKAMLPASAALGGMVCPALIFALFNWNTDSIGGWGIPMATDIAFAMGCIALLGRRVPPALGVFLVALAIVDDLGAVAVIAVFYTDQLHFQPLGVGGALIITSLILNLMGVRKFYPYALIGLIGWFCFLRSGVHATVAGVLFAFTIPADARYHRQFFHDRLTTLLARFKDAATDKDMMPVNQQQQELIRKIQKECEHVEAPLQRLEYALHPLSVFVIMPIFALANSGVQIPMGQLVELFMQPVTLGVFLGLFFGKQIGITLFAWVAVKAGLAELPRNISWKQVYAVGCLGGIGFTMALFINELAFSGAKPGVHAATEGTALAMNAIYVSEGKLGILAASILAGIAGLVALRLTCPQPPEGGYDGAGGHGH